MSFDLREDFGIIDFVDGEKRGADLLPEFLKYSDNIVAFIKTILPEIQELHDAQADVYSTINIFEAIGSQLDDIFGELLDTPRILGQTDEEYRADLLVAVAKFARSGDIVLLKNIYRSILQATSVRLYEYQPHMFKLEASVQGLGQQTAFTLVESNPQLNSLFGLSGGIGTGGILVESGVTLGDEIDARLAKAREAISTAKQGGVQMELSINTKTAFNLVANNPQSNSPNGLTDGTFEGGSLSISF